MTNKTNLFELAHFQPQDLDRPPLLGTHRTYYDEDDPEASQKALEWQMSFDASTADRLTTARSLAPSIQGGLSRERALRGTRILGCDPGLQRSMGIGRPLVETSIGMSRNI